MLKIVGHLHIQTEKKSPIFISLKSIFEKIESFYVVQVCPKT